MLYKAEHEAARLRLCHAIGERGKYPNAYGPEREAAVRTAHYEWLWWRWMAGAFPFSRIVEATDA